MSSLLSQLPHPGRYLLCVLNLPLALLAAPQPGLSPAPRCWVKVVGEGDLRSYELRTEAELRENTPPSRSCSFSELKGQPLLRTGNLLFDSLHALALHEARQNSVSAIQDHAFANNTPLSLQAFETGEKWTYVWTRDLSYAVDLGLAGFDAPRAVSSLLFKTSVTKDSVSGGYRNQIIQDTGSGGSYPVSTDRIVWALGADAALRRLPAAERAAFLAQVYPILHDTIEQDRRLIFDPADGLYRGEQSFLDWREQTYPLRTQDAVLPIALSKALSVNVLYCRALDRASAYAELLGHSGEADRYAAWAAELRLAINRGFWDEARGLYGTYLYSEGGPAMRVQRHDLLGLSLAILYDVASPAQVASILKSYPVGPHGPSVVWPQERGVPIYHNQAIWPFVTGYWLKAARKAGNAEAIDLAIDSLQRGAAENLSNMENFDFVTGKAEVKGAVRNGPVVNSRRQLWSVGAYLGMVQEVVFGLESSWQGLRFQPCVTAGLRLGSFGTSEVVELRDIDYQGARLLVRLHLPPLPAEARGICRLGRSVLNGVAVGDNFVPREKLAASNQWDLYLEPPSSPGDAGNQALRRVDVTDESALFAPAQPQWDESRGAITVEKERLVLHFLPGGNEAVHYNIYCDGILRESAWTRTEWVDAQSADHEKRVRFYAVEAIDPKSGNASHLSPVRPWLGARAPLHLFAKAFSHRGGELVDDHHLAEWGRRGDFLETRPFQASRTGRHQVRVEFSNGSGPVNTGITCGVKRLELLCVADGKRVSSGYLVMPQSGDGKRWDLSSPVLASLEAGKEYVLRVSEDEVSRNMSYLANNTRYTSWPGGGDGAYNLVSIASLQVLSLD